ncbi:Gene Transfer Agent (GTA) [Candidatus Rhodobacter oscarellae]|uniref:Gene Transfer Agent (GTA) n=1 Tax=Candidatus Rhodobacter oscarellae TaxID=1675527 RepID=A0A0J9E1G6_9RHOB|nr:head-tail adaptor protein [Candidatus Rhodobacter lobularis]KMW56580.1 Gene Transfer Agent (GTA) [Candidatus Rhodobacter lobularis]
MKRPQLNRKLRLEVPYRTRDNAGGYSETWQVAGTLWASVKAGTGRDAEQAGLSISTVPYKITLRAAPFGAPSRPKPGQRMRDGERIFSLLAVTEADFDARYLVCFARAEEVST